MSVESHSNINRVLTNIFLIDEQNKWLTEQMNDKKENFIHLFVSFVQTCFQVIEEKKIQWWMKMINHDFIHLLSILKNSSRSLIVNEDNWHGKGLFSTRILFKYSLFPWMNLFLFVERLKVMNSLNKSNEKSIQWLISIWDKLIFMNSRRENHANDEEFQRSFYVIIRCWMKLIWLVEWNNDDWLDK